MGTINSVVLDLNNINGDLLWDIKDTLYNRKLLNYEQINDDVYRLNFDDNYIFNPYRQGYQVIPQKLYYIDGILSLEKRFSINVQECNIFQWLDRYFPELNIFMKDENIESCDFIFRQPLASYKSQTLEVTTEFQKIKKYIDEKLDIHSLTVLVLAEITKKFYMADQNFSDGFYIYRKYFKGIEHLFKKDITFEVMINDPRIYDDTAIDESLVRPNRNCSFFRIEFLDNIIGLFPSIRNCYSPIFRLLELYQHKMGNMV